MTAAIRQIIEASGHKFCPNCYGSGEVDSFCGHTVTKDCQMCAGHGVVKSLRKRKHKKICSICSGRGGIGCCNKKGYHEWESFELFEPPKQISTKDYSPINLNDQIKFKITPSGQKYLDELAKTDPVYKICGPPKFRECEDGFAETELWHFASVFGQKMWNGGDVPVETSCFIRTTV